MSLAVQRPNPIDKSFRLILTQQRVKAVELFNLCRDRAGQYWFIVKRAPLPFFISFMLGLGLAHWWSGKQLKSLKQKHRAEIQSYNAQISWLQQRLFGKDDLLNQYREKLNLSRLALQQDQTTMSGSTNAQLKRRALQLVGEVRNLVAQWQAQTAGGSPADLNSVEKDKTDGEKTVPSQQASKGNTLLTSELVSQYDKEFKTAAIMLRDEISSRLPEKTKMLAYGFYEHPTDSDGIRMATDDLERLATALPSN